MYTFVDACQKWFPVGGVTDSWLKAPKNQKANSDPLEEQQTPLATMPSLYPLFFLSFKYFIYLF